MVNYEQQEFEEAMLESLNATEDTLKVWENSPYLVDSDLVSRFWDYINRAPAVGIVGDYDLDGIFASYIMLKSIKEVCPEKKAVVRLPRRFSEGYGINEKIADEIREKLPVGSVVITVDNGIAAGRILEQLEADGYPVLLTDHHSYTGVLPNVKMVIDPAVPEASDGFPFTGWCGAAVAFKMCEQMLPESLAKELEVYAGIATVVDCMQLRGSNWGLVRKAIAAFRKEHAPQPLYEMLVAMEKDPKFVDEDIFGYYIGPCCNAAGRLKDDGASEVLKYLVNPTEERLSELVEYNNQRKTMRNEEYELVKEYIEQTGQVDACPIWVAIPNLSEGIVGILAGKVAEDYGAPAIVLTTVEGKPDMYKGSGRSVGNLNIFGFLSKIDEDYREELGYPRVEDEEHPDGISIFIYDNGRKMGGHAGAAGLSIPYENLLKISSYQIDKKDIMLASEATECVHIEPYEIPEINKILCKYRPFGEGHPAPVFDLDVNISKEGGRMIGKDKNHLLIEGTPKYDYASKRTLPSWKITHFNHTPNELKDGNCFGMRGKISGSSFAGRETPTFNAEEVHDIVITRHDKAPGKYDPRDTEIHEKC